jgi:predicted glutamine amidotransferase
MLELPRQFVALGLCAIITLSISNYFMYLQNMMAHVRYATQGCVSMENVHPFSRELWGIYWCFAHNGDVPKFNQNWDYREDLAPCLGKAKEVAFRSIGDTDSEAVFCAILNALKAEFDSLPTLPVLHAFLRKLCDEIIEGYREETIFNFLLGCGQYTLFAYSWPGRRSGSKVWNGLHYIVREPPFTTASLIDDDCAVDFAQVTTSKDRVAVITTKPLTNEIGWTEFKRGELLMFDHGIPYASPETCESVEKQGRGLYSKCFGKGCPKKLFVCPRTEAGEVATIAFCDSSVAETATTSTSCDSSVSSQEPEKTIIRPSVVEC